MPRDRGVVSVYNDSKILITWAYAMKKMEIEWSGTNKFQGIITSMARLPVDRPYLYMTYANYINLGPNSQALHCKAKVTPHGIRTPWKTGSTVVQPVNSDMMVYGVTSVGLNHYMDTCMATVKGTTTNTMKPQEVKMFTREDHQKLSQYFWGHPPGAPLADDEATIPTCMSAPRHNFAYDYILSHNISPRLNKYTNVFPFKGHVGLPAVNYEHTFEQAWLKWGNNYAGGNDFLTHSAMAIPVDAAGETVYNFSSTAAWQQEPIMYNLTRHRLLEDTIYPSYFDPMENDLKRRGMGPMPPGHSGSAQPSLGFGIMAVSKSSPDDASTYDKFQEVQAFFQVDTELTVYTEVDTLAPNIMMGTTQEPYLKLLSDADKIIHPESSLSRQGRRAVLHKPTTALRNAVIVTTPAAAAAPTEEEAATAHAQRTRRATVPFLPK